MTVLFVGDRPSRHNIDPAKAFIGTRSHRTLLQWCKKIGCTEPQMINQIDLNLDQHIILCNLYKVPIVALGRHAEKRLRSKGVNFFYLPHPSGANRTLNNKVWLAQRLQECKVWLEKFSEFLR